jgi:hypothetical protein
MLSYKNVSVATAFISIALCLVLMFTPSQMFALFSVEANESAIFMGRRMAILFLGLALITGFTSDAQHSDVRQALCMALSVMLFALAFLGIFEFMRVRAGSGIWLAIVTEMILAASYLMIWLKGAQQQSVSKE